MAAYGWSGELVRLVPLEKEKHLENALSWLNDSEVTARTTLQFPLARLAEEDYFDKAERRFEQEPNEVSFAVETLEGEHVGFTAIHRIEWRHGVGTTGTILGQAHWRKGYGTDTARVRSRYCFEVLGLRVLLSEVIGDNEASLTMLAKVGYEEVGRLPERYWARGGYRDLHLFALSRQRWTELSAAISQTSTM